MEIRFYSAAISGRRRLYIEEAIAFLSLVGNKFIFMASCERNAKFGQISLHTSFRTQAEKSEGPARLFSFKLISSF